MYNIQEIVDENTLEYDCLDYYVYDRTKLANQDLYDVIDEVISFCIRPTHLSNDPMDTFVHPLAHQLSFEDINLMSITPEQLLSWSIPKIIIDDYQRYLMNSETVSLNNYFYNCTFPQFGFRCQYSFESRYKQGMSFNDIVNATFQSKQSYSESQEGTMMRAPLPCYVLIECHRNGIEWCLDWREICDGIVDCFDESSDEEYCFLMEINECKEDEYRCHNGICIAEDLWNDGEGEADCLDRSDEILFASYLEMCYQDVSFRCEEHSCRPDGETFSCGDGQCVTRYEYCHSGRHQLLIDSMMQKGDLKKECWITMICLTKLVKEINGTSCHLWLMNAFPNQYLLQCPSFFQFPTVPVYSDYVQFFYENISLQSNLTNDFAPDYICYTTKRCEFHRNDSIYGDLVCIKEADPFLRRNNTAKNPWSKLIRSIEQTFRRCLVSNNLIRGKTTYLNYTTLYQCSNSLKMISLHRIKDGIVDCIDGDDENFFNSCQINYQRRIKCGGAEECWSPIQKEHACRSSSEQSKEILPFQSFCDGISHYFYHNLKREMQVEEDECDMNKLCDNMYSRCDGFWACPDGRDEWNCTQSICPATSHPCISPYNYTISCLNYTRVNDGNDDCLGATDEPEYCHLMFNSHRFLLRFRCLNGTECLSSSVLCDEHVDCPHLRDDEEFCKHHSFSCQYKNISYQRNQIEQILCGLNENIQHHIKFFSVITSSPYPISIKLSNHNDQIDSLKINKEKEDDSIDIKKNLIYSKEDQQWSHYCNRGIMIKKETNNKSSYECLCSSSYYGQFCQYENQRISLSLKLSSINRYEIYEILILLLNDKQNQIITYSQFQYIPKESCTTKFNRILLYSIRPKNNFLNYTIRIDIIEKNSMIYIGHWFYSIPFLFLPVNRMSIALNLSSNLIQTRKCLNKCLNKQQECMEYVNKYDQTFCRWKNSEFIKHKCQKDSIFIGFTEKNHSICVLSLITSNCLINPCQNQGKCIKKDQNLFHEKNYTCICIDERYYGTNCQYKKWQLDVSFIDINIPKYIIAHFFTTSNDSEPQRTILLRKFSLFQHSVSFHISIPYHLVFIQTNENQYYLIYLQHLSSPMYTLTQVTSKQECYFIDQYVNSTVLNLHRYERIVHFHRICLENWNLICFIDEMYLCLCTKDHHANCLPFHQENSFQCSLNDDQYCLNQGQCYQDHSYCPSTKICLCTNCFFGQQCQFYTKGLGSTLDEILGYEFLRNKNLFSQSFSIQFSAGLTILLFFIGIINGILSMMTFTQKKAREVGCGLYLFSSSITSLITITLFTMKFCLLYLSYQNLSNLQIILTLNCRFIEILLKLFLFIDNWLNTCVAIERTYSVTQGLLFNKRKSRKIAKQIIIPCIFIGNIILLVPHIIYLHIFEDQIEGRTWCVIYYKTWLKFYTIVMIFLNYFVPLIIQISSTIIIIIVTARQRSISQVDVRFWNHLRRKIRKYKQLLISPMIIILLTLPHLIVTVILDCNKSSRLFWFFLLSYFSSFIPATFVFTIFVIPSPLYRKQFKQCIRHIQRRFKRY
ncbi:unnamed protein product [Adineta ricciae]|uniref:Uncharacterized protein n=1 Tax=Adineta ricciae TaxID=249248 RepID=A0A815GKB8_ADIRI|nr:unnamed protein product [Adineta ricciae]